MLGLFILGLLAWDACGGAAQHCPVDTARVALDCQAEVKAGTKTKQQCYDLIEKSCP